MQVAIMLYPGFTALDFIGPYECLRMLPGTEVRFVWHEPGPIAADSAVLLVGATHSFDETPSPDVILIPGGFSTMEHARDGKVLDWVRTAHRTSTWTASVCSGSVILAAAGLLDGKRATTHWLGAQAFRSAFPAVHLDADVLYVDEGQLLTSAGATAGQAQFIVRNRRATGTGLPDLLAWIEDNAHRDLTLKMLRPRRRRVSGR